ncbi:magnesium transporter [candidate division CSSED10-310 bacterium]|uniref:Magnesium transporter MgtE n=1 Tax=candidate division CSSED10-310 bacterium TaxID=2855610 RepID=A0ABV6Z357_UNCC1
MFLRSQLQQTLAKLIRSGNKNKILRIIEKLHIVEIEEIFLNLMPVEQREFLIILFEVEQAGKTLIRLPKSLSQELLEKFNDQQLVTMLNRLSSKESKSLLRYVPEERMQRILSFMEGDESTHLTELLLHPEDSAGDLMSPHFFTLPGDMLVREAIEYPRQMEREVSFNNIYVVDEHNRISGVIPIQELLLVDLDRSLADIMNRDVITIPPESSKQEVADYITRYNLLAMPVVDEMGVIKGIVSIDSIIEVLQDEATEDMYKIAGLDKEDRVFVRPLQSVQKRLPWLSINILTALAGASVVNFFQSTIDQMVALVIFMPVIAGLGGNTGAQTLTVIVRGIALGEVQLSAARRIILKELTVGLINGVIIGFLIAMVAIIWKGPVFLGIIVALAIVCNLLMASLIGSLVPLTLKYLGFDPAIASNIFVTATTDMFGFFVYLGLASIFMIYLV